MKILITGGTGFIGQKLCHFLLHKNHQLTVLSRKPEKVSTLCGALVIAIRSIDQLDVTDAFDAIINLAGEGIADARQRAIAYCLNLGTSVSQNPATTQRIVSPGTSCVRLNSAQKLLR